MRIVQLIPTLSVGGAERIVALLAHAQTQVGHDVHIVVLGSPEDSWIERWVRTEGIDVHFLDKGPGFEARVVGRLARTLRRLRPDVVHTHLHVLKYLLPSRLLHRPAAIVHTLHNLAENEAVRSDQLVQQAVFRWRVAPVAIGAAVAESVRAVYDLEPAAVIPNGIEVARFAPAAGVRDRLRAELDLPASACVFVVVGRLNPQKNHTLLLDAFARVSDSAHLVVVGDGELRAQLEQAAPAARVHFLGIRRDVPDLLAAADVFVLASDWEGNPLVVMEALAAGKPVVATAVGCVPELVVDGTGQLVPKGDSPALTAAMQNYVDTPAAVHADGSAARSHALGRFDVSAMARAYLALYRARGAT